MIYVPSGSCINFDEDREDLNRDLGIYRAGLIPGLFSPKLRLATREITENHSEAGSSSCFALSGICGNI